MSSWAAKNQMKDIWGPCWAFPDILMNETLRETDIYSISVDGNKIQINPIDFCFYLIFNPILVHSGETQFVFIKSIESLR